MVQKVGRREKLAEKVGRREIYHPVPPPSKYILVLQLALNKLLPIAQEAMA